MLSLANRDVAETLRAFSAVGVDCTFLVPTETGLGKAILDATDTVRVWLREQGFHDYSTQGQGEDHKVQIETVVVSRGEVSETKASLYRPETKSGDPRIWFGLLGRYADPTDLLAICSLGERLLVVNCSKNDLNQLLNDDSSIFWRVYREGNSAAETVARISQREIDELLQDRPSAPTPRLSERPPLVLGQKRQQDLDLVIPQRPAEPAVLRVGNTNIPTEALELLGLLKVIAAKGFIPTMRSGDTGVGFTLETLLGIKCNSNQTPDYKGIEIKSGRAKSHLSGRTTIFSQVPDWEISRLKGTSDILRERGRFHEVKGRVQLFHEMVATKINSYGLSLKVDHNAEVLHQVFSEDGNETLDATWRLSKLFERLLEKHKHTFWIKADTNGKGVSEAFHYTKARYTSGVSPSKFPMLLEAGVISLDYTMKVLPNGSAKDQGYLFKIRQADLPLLFKSPVEFDLTA